MAECEVHAVYGGQKRTPKEAKLSWATEDFRDVTGSKGNEGGCCQGLARRDNEFS